MKLKRYPGSLKSLIVTPSIPADRLPWLASTRISATSKKLGFQTREYRSLNR